MAELSRRLTNLTRKDLKEFVWTQECVEAFEEIKRRLVIAPLLHPQIYAKSSICGLMSVLKVLGLYWSRRMRMAPVT